MKMQSGASRFVMRYDQFINSVALCVLIVVVARMSYQVGGGDDCSC
jgi:hypothetical protein